MTAPTSPPRNGDPPPTDPLDGGKPSSESKESAAADGAAAMGAGKGAGHSPLDGLEQNFSELLAYLAHYLAAQRDWLAWRLMAACWRVIVMLGAGLTLLGVLIAAGVFVLHGAAHGVGSALGGRIWAGELIVGLTALVLLAIFQSIAFRRLRGRRRERTLEKYENIRKRERAAFGRDIRRSTARRVD